MKIGRNEPCPCGSGKKYKSCCLGRLVSGNQAPPPSPRFRFEPGSYGGPSAFIPSIGCLKQRKPDAWRYHFVLVKRDVECREEAEAVLLAAEDLNQAFGDEASLGQRVAECLKALGYIRVEGFNIVDRSATPVA
jgi:SEC-C motif